MARVLSSEWFARRAFKRKLQVEMLEDLVVALRCNLTVKDELEQIVLFGNSKLATPARAILREIKRAKPFSLAAVGWFPAVVIQAIKTGEANRCMPDALANAISVLKNGGILLKLIGSNMYGASLFSLGTSAPVAAYKYIFIPKLKVIKFDEFPFISKIAYWIGDFLSSYSNAILIGLLAFSCLMFFLMNMRLNSFRKSVERFPFFNLYRLCTAISFLSSLTLMFKNKVALNVSLPLIANNSDGYMQGHTRAMIRHLKSSKSRSLADIIDTGLFDKAEVCRIKALTSRNNRETGFVLEKCTERHQILLDAKIKRIGVVVGGVSMVYVAIMIIIVFGGASALNMIGVNL